MKKFVALVVLFCAVMFSSTVTAEDYFLAANGKILCMTYVELFHEAEHELAVEKHMRLSAS